VSKGAFENVMTVCTTILVGSSTETLDAAERQRLRDYHRQKSSDGFRILALARKKVTAAKSDYKSVDEVDMTFCGFLFFLDPVRSDAAKTIADLANLGIAVKIITGDNRYVAAHIAKDVGLDPQAMLTGSEIADMRDEALWNHAPRTLLFVEVDPQQKERIVRALQRTGHSVGYLGDGINDGPALYAADVGISVDTAVDIARESADIILLKPDLDVLRNGVENGRRTFANTLKYISITISANFGNMVSMALATPLLPFLPLTPTLVLLNNLLSDIPLMAIAGDSVDPEALERPQRWTIAGLRRFMLVFGLVSSAFDALTFVVLLLVFHADETTFHAAWFLISLLTEVAVVFFLRTQRPAIRSHPSSTLLWVTVAVGVVALLLPFIPVVGPILELVPLSGPLMGTCVAIVACYVAATEAAKSLYFGKLHATSTVSAT
jgi:Mg2+-importing ATPase